MKESHLFDTEYETEDYSPAVVRIIWIFMITGSISMWFLLFYYWT